MTHSNAAQVIRMLSIPAGIYCEVASSSSWRCPKPGEIVEVLTSSGARIPSRVRAVAPFGLPPNTHSFVLEAVEALSPLVSEPPLATELRVIVSNAVT
jgi:hypothetical protein